MARAALRLSVRGLALLAKVSAMTVTRLENGRSGGYAETVRKIQAALEVEGIEFIEGDAPGVKLRKPVPPRPKKKKKAK
ncbi:MAG TPA: helix-turn-helix transcriptional regulator [Rhizomicrobium sp.]|nr:helix-turn-helix transcriptional regulator [Rhizomicrobium sp.]